MPREVLSQSHRRPRRIIRVRTLPNEAIHLPRTSTDLTGGLDAYRLWHALNDPLSRKHTHTLIPFGSSAYAQLGLVRSTRNAHAIYSWRAERTFRRADTVRSCIFHVSPSFVFMTHDFIFHSRSCLVVYKTRDRLIQKGSSTFFTSLQTSDSHLVPLFRLLPFCLRVVLTRNIPLIPTFICFLLSHPLFLSLSAPSSVHTPALLRHLASRTDAY